MLLCWVGHYATCTFGRQINGYTVTHITLNGGWQRFSAVGVWKSSSQHDKANGLLLPVPSFHDQFTFVHAGEEFLLTLPPACCLFLFYTIVYLILSVHCWFWLQLPRSRSTISRPFFSWLVTSNQIQSDSLKEQNPVSFSPFCKKMNS